MLAYIVSFVFSLTFMKWAIKNRSKFTSFLFHLFAMLPPVLLLTFRAEGCGTDTTNYINVFDSFATESLGTLIAATRYELLFLVLVYIVGKLGLSVQFLFFICALLTLAPVYWGVLRMKDKASPILSMSLFYLMFYTYSFNIVRQSIAMSFLLLAVVFLLERRLLASILIGFIAVLFHTVAIVFFALLLVYFFVWERRTFIFVLLIILIGALYFVPTIFMEIIHQYDAYLESADDASMQYSYFVEMLINFLIVRLWFSRKDRLSREFFLWVSGICFVSICFSTIAPYAFRVSNCIDILTVLYVPMALKTVKNKVYVSLYLSFAVFYWWFVFIYNASGGAYPYAFSSSVIIF